MTLIRAQSFRLISTFCDGRVFEAKFEVEIAKLLQNGNMSVLFFQPILYLCSSVVSQKTFFSSSMKLRAKS
jgi:hypothetical protein